jgi:hypothetical protein
LSTTESTQECTLCDLNGTL